MATTVRINVFIGCSTAFEPLFPTTTRIGPYDSVTVDPGTIQDRNAFLYAKSRFCFDNTITSCDLLVHTVCEWRNNTLRLGQALRIQYDLLFCNDYLKLVTTLVRLVYNRFTFFNVAFSWVNCYRSITEFQLQWITPFKNAIVLKTI